MALAPGGSALLQVMVEDLNKRMSPREFMLSRMGLKDLKAEGSISPSNLQGYSAVAIAPTSAGEREMRFTVIYFNDKAYILAGTVKDPKTIPVHDRAFLDTARSFHPLQAHERELAKPLRLKIVRASQGATFGHLAGRSPFTKYAEQRLRLLNGAYPHAEPQPGQLLKVVVQ
jgi:predicted Zn-dependent protease